MSDLTEKRVAYRAWATSDAGSEEDAHVYVEALEVEVERLRGQRNTLGKTLGNLLDTTAEELGKTTWLDRAAHAALVATLEEVKDE
jgi:hypothetical protein